MPNLLLGMRRALLSGRPGLTYLLRDQFTTAESAPLASPRTCEPGPGTLTITDSGSKLAISSGRLVFDSTAVTAWEDPLPVGDGVARTAGRAFLSLFQIPAGKASNFLLGWRSAATGGSPNVPYALYNGDAWDGANVIGSISTLSTATDYEAALVARATGCFLLLKGGTFTDWTLVWVFSSGSAATLYPSLQYHTSANALQSDNWRVLDLPAPWTTDYGIATQRVSGAVSNGQTFIHTANCLLEIAATRGSSGTTDLVFRKQDASNKWRLMFSHGDGVIYLQEMVGGVWTSRGNTSTAAFASGTRVVVVADGTTIRLYVSNTLRVTYSSASNFQTETDGELIDTSVGGAFADLIAWPRDVSSLIPSGV